MQKYAFILLFILSNLAFGQDPEDLTETYITHFQKELKRKNIDDFFVVKHIQYGTARFSDTNQKDYCEKEEHYYRIYAFWKEGNDHWLKAFDNCGGFVPVKLHNKKALNFYNKHFEDIKFDEVERYKIKPDSLANGKKYSFISMQNHTPLRYFWFFKSSVEFRKHFNTHNLTSYKKSPNINYKKNKNLKLVSFDRICDAIIEKFVKTEDMIREE